MPQDNFIPVTRPALGRQELFHQILEDAWKSGILTHNGPILRRFERELASKIDLKRIITVTNGTVALEVAIKALEIKGEILTTPFTWIATASAIKAQGCEINFCDICPETFNIDAEKLEGCITEKTEAIMPVHVFGNPCDVEKIDALAKAHNIKVIYDAAHALGSTHSGDSLLRYGDVSCVSLHGTKLFNTAEGGACVTSNDELLEKIERIRFFGHDNNKNIVENGINAKMTEIHAALGLTNLELYDVVLKARRLTYLRYLKNLEGSSLRYQKLLDGANFSYFPVVFSTEPELLFCQQVLNDNGIGSRRYFYPSLTEISVLSSRKFSAPISEDLSKKILCLPLYYELSNNDVDRICEILMQALAKIGGDS